MKKLRSISSFKSGEKIQGFYLCLEKFLRYTRSGDLYIDLNLRDNTGKISAKIWDNVSALEKKFEAGNAVVVSGNIETFQDKNQLIIKKINKATVQYYGRYGFDPIDIVPSSEKNPNKMFNDIIQISEKIDDKYLRKLVFNIFRKNKKKIMLQPATVYLNHNYRSGLLEHILSMIKIAKKISNNYKLDSDLVISGILLKEIGVIHALDSEYKFKSTNEGNLLGSNVISRDIFRDEISKIKNFPIGIARKIEHIIISCGGIKNDALQKPSFPEALFINKVSILDAEINIMQNTLKDDKENENFTSIHNYFGRPLYKGE